MSGAVTATAVALSVSTLTASAIVGAGVGAALGGISAAVQGGDIGMGILGGGLGGAVTGGFASWAGPMVGGLAAGAIGGAGGGALNAAITGGDVLTGAMMGGATGAVVGGLSGSDASGMPGGEAMGEASGAASGYGAESSGAGGYEPGMYGGDAAAESFGYATPSSAVPGSLASSKITAEPLGAPVDVNGNPIGNPDFAVENAKALLENGTPQDIAKFNGLPEPIQDAAISKMSPSLVQNQPAGSLQSIASSGQPPMLQGPTMSGEPLSNLPMANAGGAQGLSSAAGIPNDPLSPLERAIVTGKNIAADYGPMAATSPQSGYQLASGTGPGGQQVTGLSAQPVAATSPAAPATPWMETGIGAIDKAQVLAREYPGYAMALGGGALSMLGGSSDQGAIPGRAVDFAPGTFNKPLPSYGYLQPGGDITQYRQVAQRPSTLPAGQSWGYNAQGQLVPVTYDANGALVQVKGYKAGGEIHGGQDDTIPILGARGEYMLPADVVSGLGDGSSDAGAAKLDKFVKGVRKHKASNGGLPKRAMAVGGYLRSA